MPRFKHYNYDQNAMVVISYQEQIQPGTFEHAVHYLIEHKLDQDIRRAKIILSLDEAAKKVDRFLKTNRPRVCRGERSKEVKSNLTDNESAKMTISKGTIQGYNGVATVDRKQLRLVVNNVQFRDGERMDDQSDRDLA